jgi:thiol-disulfide isomerase/thioredoxin
MENERARRSKLWWVGVGGASVVVAAMIAALCLLQMRNAEPSPVDTSVPGLAGPPGSNSVSDPSTPVVGHRVGDVAPSFTLPTLDGASVSLANYAGRVVILDFWASWCVPCRLSMPSLEAMARDLGDEVVLVGVSLDRSETEARSYVASREYAALVPLYGSLTQARAVAGDYGVLGIPRTFVIDRDGVVRFAGHPNRLSRDLVETLL